MLYEDLRYIHEDSERLEQAVADRILDEPKNIRLKLVRDHEIANLLSRIHSQSQEGLKLYNDQNALTQEVQSISTGDPFDEFYKQLDGIKDFHKRYPNEPVENLERAYKRVGDGGPALAGDIDSMFTGEEALGRFFDLTMMHEEFLNLPGVKAGRKLTYIQYLDVFDKFMPPECLVTRHDKMSEQYFSYVQSLSQYLESFLRRTRPLEDFEKLFAAFDEEFSTTWEKDAIPEWKKQVSNEGGVGSAGPDTEGSGQGIWCADCKKEFQNDNVYKAHLKGKKHIKNAEARQQAGREDVAQPDPSMSTGYRLKERAVAFREYRVSKLTKTMETEREETRSNVERRAIMTDRERQQERDAFLAEEAAIVAPKDDAAEGEDGEEKIYNPLKLPLSWDGRPIPFWLFKLHGLGVEFPCEICGNYVYMGRRAFEKHFSEARHIYGLKCLGITNTSMFREITGIEEAGRLWEKIKRDKTQIAERNEGVEEMEDSMGNVMPRKVYEDLEKAGLL